MSNQAGATQYVALIRTEFPDGRLNALPGDICKVDHLSKGKIGLLVKMGAIMPKTEYDALPDEDKERIEAETRERLFPQIEAVYDDGSET